MDAPMMQIGGITKESMEAASQAIINVATCSQNPEIAVKALDALMRLGETNNIHISHCNLTTIPASHNGAVSAASMPLQEDDNEGEKSNPLSPYKNEGRLYPTYVGDVDDDRSFPSHPDDPRS